MLLVPLKKCFGLMSDLQKSCGIGQSSTVLSREVAAADTGACFVQTPFQVLERAAYALDDFKVGLRRRK